MKLGLSETARAVLDTSRLEDLWAYLFEREVGMGGEWRLEAQFGDSQLRRRHFHMIGVNPGEQGPIRGASERGL